MERVKHPRASNRALPWLLLRQPLPLPPRLLFGLGPHPQLPTAAPHPPTPPTPTPPPTAGRRHRWQARMKPPARLTQLSLWREPCISSSSSLEQLGAGQPGPSCSLSLVQGSRRHMLLRPLSPGKEKHRLPERESWTRKTSNDNGFDISLHRWGN